MSEKFEKVVEVYTFNGQGYKLSCGHENHIISDAPYKVGDKFPCKACQINQSQITAVRAENERLRKLLKVIWVDLDAASIWKNRKKIKDQIEAELKK